MKKSKKKRKHRLDNLTPEQEIALIESRLGYATFARETDTFDWVDMEHRDMNEALGHPKYGIRFGSVVEIYGWESHGKTALATCIAAKAQAQDPEHTYVAKADLEMSNNDTFNEAMGINLGKFFLFKPKIAATVKALRRLQRMDPKKDPERYKKALLKADKFVETAEMVCDKIEKWIKFRREQDPAARIVLIMDSVTGMLVNEEEEAGLMDGNMRTKVSLASFLSTLLRRWVTFADNYNTLMIFINQLRVAPGVMFGNPEYTSGGKALKFYSSIRAKVARVKGGRIKKHGRVIGIRSMVTNTKNKVGGAEGHKAGIKILTRKGRFYCLTPEDIVREAKREKNGEA